MPLEQLRPAVALDPEPRRSSSFFEGEPTSSPDTFEDDGNGSASGTRKDAGMTLTKLGGVGGVTRSGSWGRSTASGVGLDEATHSSSQREDWKQGEGSGEGSKTRRPSAKASGNSEDNLPSSSSSDVPSSSSRTSTSSYSAAAFSLMSVSNRSSIAGSSSSASSTRSRAPSDSSQRHSLSPPNSRGRDSESDATSVGGAPSEGPSSDATCTDISQDELSASERDRSSAPHQGGVRTVSSGRVSSLGSLGTFPSRHDQSIMTPSRALAVETENASFQRPEPTLLSSSGNGKAREVVDNCDAGRTLRSSGQSSSLSSSPRASSSSASISPITPRTPSYDPICVPSRRTGADLTVEPTRAQTANLHLRRLTQELSASPLNEASEDFQPPLPRRHSGVFLSRTRSQLAQHPSVNSRFAGAGGGRAAARERAGYSIEYDNAPFSVLEARSNASQHRGAASQPPSPAARTVPNSPWALSPIAMERTPTPASISSPTSVGNSETGWLSRSLVSQNSSFASLAPLSDIAPLLSSKTKAGNHSAPDLQEDVESTAGPSTGSDTTEGASTSRSGLLRPKSKPIPAPLETQASNANFTSLQVLSRSPHPSSSSAPDEKVASIGLGIDGSLSPGLPTRPPMSRSSTTTSMVMRTPTTAEWSRFLESQGMDPVVAGRRSRTPTARSAASSRRSSRLGMSRPVAADTDSDDDSASDDSTLEATPDVAESMKHLNLSRGGSRVASSAGGDPRLADDLESFDEEDELRDPRRDSSSSNEPMDALHEVISRPASRRASPHSSPRIPRSPAMTPLTVHRPVVTSDLPEGPDFSAPRSPSRLKRADRETAAVVLGYPLPPPGQSRSIHDFVIISDIGRGAYGLVKKARLKGLDGHPVGDEFIIKYIIKSRILADCWRRHRALGPIPIEIHVMDQLRRLQYTEPPEPPPWAPSRMRLRQGRPLDPEIIQSEVKAASVGHPNICKMVDFFEDHEFYYMVMPCFGTGQDLFDFVESAPDGLRADQVRSIFGQVADGLRFLHANQIVHRDVKDENVILDGHGNAQLIDFGSAAHIRPGRLFDTFSGTLDYAAAEILRGEKYGGQEQDVWALGVVGYVLFCGECPFWNGEEAIMGLAPETRAAQALQGRCLIDDGAASSSVGSSDDGGGRLTDAADLISRCLEVDPKDRPTAAQVCEHRFLVGDHGWSGRRGWLRDPTTTTATTSHPAEHADR